MKWFVKVNRNDAVSTAANRQNRNGIMPIVNKQVNF